MNEEPTLRVDERSVGSGLTPHDHVTYLPAEVLSV